MIDDEPIKAVIESLKDDDSPQGRALVVIAQALIELASAALDIGCDLENLEARVRNN